MGLFIRAVTAKNELTPILNNNFTQTVFFLIRRLSKID